LPDLSVVQAPEDIAAGPEYGLTILKGANRRFERSDDVEFVSVQIARHSKARRRPAALRSRDQTAVRDLPYGFLGANAVWPPL
jgi:hypothetical protein